ncbi:hypothetical protein NDU88_003614 [Pleurodeles waltl]|uniref:Uncharacterized protein n=1 Tax=Pleurodeles waltl TaxID=8319 RepID=A0AAV7UFP0_PLEWA|nr:hypothetical protein NDU88_003614 [Pleurodeles waltl]
MHPQDGVAQQHKQPSRQCPCRLHLPPSSSLQAANILAPGCPGPTCGLAPQSCASSSQCKGRSQAPQQPQQYRAREPGPPTPMRPKAHQAPPPLTWHRRSPCCRPSTGSDRRPAPARQPYTPLDRLLPCTATLPAAELPTQWPVSVWRDPGDHDQGPRQYRTPPRHSAPVM